MVRHKSRTSRVQKRARTSRVQRRSRVSRGQKRSKISRVSRGQKRSKISRVSKVQKRSKISRVSRVQKRSRALRDSRSQKRARNKTLQKRLKKIRNNFRGGMEAPEVEDAAGEVEFYFDSQAKVDAGLEEERKKRQGQSLDDDIAWFERTALEEEEEKRSPAASELTEPSTPTDTPAVSPSGVDVSMRGPSMTGWDALVKLARAKKPMGKKEFGQFLYNQLNYWFKKYAPHLLELGEAGGIQLKSLQARSTEETYKTPENYGKLYEYFYPFLRKANDHPPRINEESLKKIKPQDMSLAQGPITSSDRSTPMKWVYNEWSFFSNHFLDRMFSESVRHDYFSQKANPRKQEPRQIQGI